MQPANNLKPLLTKKQGILNITINGTSQQLTTVKNLSEIVSTFCKQSKHVLTELNGTIVPPDQWAQTNLQDGDALELVTFVGGG
jgi:sulfur carrier protein